MVLDLRVLIAGAALLCLPGYAVAADMDAPVLVQDAPEYVPVEVGSGWYLRGDIGYAVGTHMGDVSYRTFDPVTLTYGDGSFDDADLDGNFTGGIGFGYRFTDYLRADFTADITKFDFDGSTSSDTPCPASPVGTTCSSDDGASNYTTTLMANGYVDLGTYSGFTPYIGGGLGVSRVDWDDLTDQISCVDGAALCDGTVYDSVSHPGEDDWRFTYALMAGFAYDVTKNVKLDLGYRFRHIDGGDMFGWDEASSDAGATGIQGEDDGFSSHEVRLGLRYELW